MEQLIGTFATVNHEHYIQRCIELAENGIGKVSPNPMVGSVIVHNNNIIGEGYHQEYGKAHAEVNAINSVKDSSILKESTIYVSLEPCAHFGKTPPCSDLIIEKGIPHVVIGCTDPFAEVAGKGIEKLKAAGVQVELNILQKECEELNRRFFTYHNQKRPYIILKWAQTQDGFIDKKRDGISSGINWITHPHTQQLTHLWRSEEDAILAGKNTVINDNPSLTTRAITGKNPIRVVIDRKLEISTEYKVYDGTSKTIVFNEVKQEESEFLTYRKVDFNDLLPQLLDVLYQQEIQSLIVEGGAHTINQFINSGLWDEARVLTGESSFESGLRAPEINQPPVKSFNYKRDLIKLYRNA